MARTPSSWVSSWSTVMVRVASLGDVGPAGDVVGGEVGFQEQATTH